MISLVDHLMNHVTFLRRCKFCARIYFTRCMYIKQLLDEVEHDIMNYQNRGLCYLSKPKAEAHNTDTRF